MVKKNKYCSTSVYSVWLKKTKEIKDIFCMQ